MEYVLIPETGVRLIMEDMQMDWVAARKVMKRSLNYGIHMFPDSDDEYDAEISGQKRKQTRGGSKSSADLEQQGPSKKLRSNGRR
jgi:hypothetical protein